MSAFFCNVYSPANLTYILLFIPRKSLPCIKKIFCFLHGPVVGRSSFLSKGSREEAYLWTALPSKWLCRTQKRLNFHNVIAWTLLPHHFHLCHPHKCATRKEHLEWASQVRCFNQVATVLLYTLYFLNSLSSFSKFTLSWPLHSSLNHPGGFIF